ncbi:SdpA family antimicrobial peptide system protein [Echinicola soli]
MAFLSSTGFNPLTLDYRESKLVYTVIPQGWGFFTRDPREPYTLLYKRTGDKLNLINDSGAEPRYLFGLSRSTRRQNIELGSLYLQVPDSMWVSCPSKAWKECVPDDRVFVSDSFKHPRLSGEYLLIRQAPVPWAWSKSYDKIKMPFEICKIYIEPVRESTN